MKLPEPLLHSEECDISEFAEQELKRDHSFLYFIFIHCRWISALILAVVGFILWG